MGFMLPLDFAVLKGKEIIIAGTLEGVTTTAAEGVLISIVDGKFRRMIGLIQHPSGVAIRFTDEPAR